jgi:hypothetical protein
VLLAFRFRPLVRLAARLLVGELVRIPLGLGSPAIWLSEVLVCSWLVSGLKYAS